MERKYTRGEWKVVASSPTSKTAFGSITIHKPVMAVVGDDLRVVAVGGIFECPDSSLTEEILANAKLISSAPDLLESLIELLSHVEDTPGSEYFDEKIFTNARKAIKKAVG